MLKSSLAMCVLFGYLSSVTLCQIFRDLGFDGLWTYGLVGCGLITGMLGFAAWLDRHDEMLAQKHHLRCIAEDEQKEQSQWN